MNVLEPTFRHLHQKLGQPLRFLITGGVSAGIYFVLAYVLVELAAIRPVWGVAIAYLFSVTFNFFTHHAWTYKSDRPKTQTAFRYIIFFMFMIVVNIAITYIINDVLSISYVYGQVIFLLVAIVLSYAIQKYWIYA